MGLGPVSYNVMCKKINMNINRIFGISISLTNLFKNEIKIGSEIKLLGGYESDPKWLNGKESYSGQVVTIIPGHNKEPSLVVKLNDTITFESYEGNYVVLELRHEGAKWINKGIVHIELYNSIPEDNQWQKRNKGTRVEAAASYEIQ